MEDTTLQELRDAVAALTEKVAVLEARVESLEDCRQIPEADIIAIGALHHHLDAAHAVVLHEPETDVRKFRQPVADL